jgi:hypothetical protein
VAVESKTAKLAAVAMLAVLAALTQETLGSPCRTGGSKRFQDRQPRPPTCPPLAALAILAALAGGHRTRRDRPRAPAHHLGAWIGRSDQSGPGALMGPWLLYKQLQSLLFCGPLIFWGCPPQGRTGRAPRGLAVGTMRPDPLNAGQTACAMLDEQGIRCRALTCAKFASDGKVIQSPITAQTPLGAYRPMRATAQEAVARASDNFRDPRGGGSEAVVSPGSRIERPGSPRAWRR